MAGDVLGIAYRPEGLMLVFAHQPALIGVGCDEVDGAFDRRRTSIRNVDENWRNSSIASLAIADGISWDRPAACSASQR